jgi:hypothetical protein
MEKQLSEKIMTSQSMMTCPNAERRKAFIFNPKHNSPFHHFVLMSLYFSFTSTLFQMGLIFFFLVPPWLKFKSLTHGAKYVMANGKRNNILFTNFMVGADEFTVYLFVYPFFSNAG